MIDTLVGLTGAFAGAYFAQKFIGIISLAVKRAALNGPLPALDRSQINK